MTKVVIRGGARAVTSGTIRDTGHFILKGDWDASTNLFPSGSIKKGWSYLATTASTTLLMNDGGIVPVGAMITAKQDNPGQTVTNWIFQLTTL